MLKDNETDKTERFAKEIPGTEETSMAESLFLDGANNPVMKETLKKEWESYMKESSSAEPNLSHLLDKVHHQIRISEINKKNRPIQKLFLFYSRAAAILLIPVVIAGVLFYRYFVSHPESNADQNVISSIYAPMGARVTFNLPDGTTGMLNSGSHLSYAIPFMNNRKIKLEGEAWFEVTHDEKHPFEISTGNSTLKVLGTSFNVSAYPAEKYVEIVLQKGKVEFLDNQANKKTTMAPSERLVFQNEQITRSVTDPAKYSAWTNGKLVFRGDPMTEVARRIERWYNVNVILADKELDKYSFRGTFEDDKLEDVLRFLAMTSPITYRISNRELLPDGTYSKVNVTIHYKK